VGSNPTPSATQSPHIFLCVIFRDKIDLTAHNARVLRASHMTDFLCRRIRGLISPTFSGAEARGVFSQDKRTYGFALTALRHSVITYRSLHCLSRESRFNGP
jgi:hypothetical protein